MKQGNPELLLETELLPDLLVERVAVVGAFRVLGKLTVFRKEHLFFSEPGRSSSIPESLSGSESESDRIFHRILKLP